MILTPAVQSETPQRGGPGTVFDIAALERAPLNRDPFEFVIANDFVLPTALTAIHSCFPSRLGPGSHPVHLVHTEGALKTLIDELHGDRFRGAVEEKFGLLLKGYPTACTLRGETNERDGNIHTDSRSKIITVLLYLNERWDHPGGKLRLLRSGDSLDDYAAEVSPVGGTLLVFRRSDNSWHGHEAFVGPRRAIQFNWVTKSSVQMREQVRHSLSHLIKKVTHFAG